MTPTAQPPEHQRPCDAAALLRLVFSWLLVAVLAVDLITSPLHAHRHDGDWAVGARLAASAEHPSELFGADSVGVSTHVDRDDGPSISHSITALRGSIEVMIGAEPLDEHATGHWFVSAPRSSSRAAAWVWPPDGHRAGAGAFKSLPPHGRAPPVHA
ncbi:MAG: hypothetical protein KXJ61_08340 [Hydrogenophaga sp.]|jgi:hypothetical protein|uniref:hypothetical protein n=1 Tax=Hydrogenophaga sp. TaxID=1904254 RepID=UPI001D7641CD|nr:hypothetical protein [Hydrogenophaga sp.]MBW0170224.1 hypothetical protein [Hydrogenophaga sp.]MBW0182382.1 hypothetical protein [Hydrogenophaga sp.]